MDSSAIRPSHVGSFLTLLTNQDIKFCSFTLTHAPLDLPLFVTSDYCLVNEAVLAGVIVIDEPVSVLSLKPFNDPKHSLIAVTAQVDKATLHLLELSIGLPVSSQGAAVRCLFILNDLCV